MTAPQGAFRGRSGAILVACPMKKLLARQPIALKSTARSPEI
jgi:hypothetical protein